MEETRDLPPEAPSGKPDMPPESAPVVEAIRAASAKYELTTGSELRASFPDLDAERLIAESGAADLKRMASADEVYYFSDRSMTDAYALHLFRKARKDPVAMIAETVRDDSRIYPRPTDIRAFLESPFDLSRSELEQALNAIGLRPDAADIRTSVASNGARYLYSSKHLVEAQADYLTEWLEVGVKENP